MVATNGTSCGKCERPLVAQGHVRLWDGHDYCLDCVSAHSDRLAAFAMRHATFVDVVRLADVFVLPKFVISLIIFVAILLLAIAVMQPDIFGPLLLLSLFLVVSYTGVYTLGCVMRYPQTTTVADGVVHVRTPIGTIQHALSDCQWTFDYWREWPAVITFLPPSAKTRSVLLHIRRPLNDAYFIVCVDKARYAVLAAFLSFVATLE